MFKKNLQFNFFTFNVGVFFFLFLGSLSFTIAMDNLEEPPPSSTSARKNYPKQLADSLHSTFPKLNNIIKITEKEYDPKGNLVKLIIKPRAFLSPPLVAAISGLFLGHTLSSIVEMNRNIIEFEKVFYKEKKTNTNVIHASRVNEITFVTWVSSPCRDRELLSKNYASIHERLLCMVNLEKSLQNILGQTLINTHKNLFLRMFYNLSNPIQEYLAQPILENGEKLLKQIDQEKDSLKMVDNINYLLSNKHYLIDTALDELIESTTDYFTKYLEQDGGKNEEIEEFKHDLLKISNLIGVIWGKQCIDEINQDKAKELCARSLSVFDLVLAFDEYEKVKLPRRPETNFNKGFIQYKYMDNLKEGLENLEQARQGLPYSPCVIAHIAFCKYLLGCKNKNEKMLPELLESLSILNEAIEISPENYPTRVVKGILLLKTAVLQYKDNPKKSIKYAKKSKEEFDKINQMRKENKLMGFEPDQYYYYPQGQAELAIGDTKNALESLRRAICYAKYKNSDNSSLNPRAEFELESIQNIIDILDKKENSFELRYLLGGSDQSKFLRDQQSILWNNIEKSHFTPVQVKEIAGSRDKILDGFKLKASHNCRDENIKYLLNSLKDISQRGCIHIGKGKE